MAEDDDALWESLYGVKAPEASLPAPSRSNPPFLPNALQQNVPAPPPPGPALPFQQNGPVQGVLGPSGRQWVRQEVQVQEVAAALPVSGDAPQTDPFDDDEDFEVELDDQGPYGAAAGDEMPATNTYQEEDEEDFELELDDKLPTEMEHPTLLAGPGVEVQPETRAGVPSFGPPPGPPPSGLPGPAPPMRPPLPQPPGPPAMPGEAYAAPRPPRPMYQPPPIQMSDEPPTLPSLAKPNQWIRLPGQTRVAESEYKEFLGLGHGDIFDLDIDRVTEAAWRVPGVDLADFFNYGLTPYTWKEYCKRVHQFRLEFAMQGNIQTYNEDDEQQPEQDWAVDPSLPPEVQAALMQERQGRSRGAASHQSLGQQEREGGGRGGHGGPWAHSDDGPAAAGRGRDSRGRGRGQRGRSRGPADGGGFLMQQPMGAGPSMMAPYPSMAGIGMMGPSQMMGGGPPGMMPGVEMMMGGVPMPPGMMHPGPSMGMARPMGMMPPPNIGPMGLMMPPNVGPPMPPLPGSGPAPPQIPMPPRDAGPAPPLPPWSSGAGLHHFQDGEPTPQLQNGSHDAHVRGGDSWAQGGIHFDRTRGGGPHEGGESQPAGKQPAGFGYHPQNSMGSGQDGAWGTTNMHNPQKRTASQAGF